MYTPKQFEEQNLAAAHKVIEDNAFAIICTADDGAAIQAVHVPTLFEKDWGAHGRIQFHVAKENPIWRLFDGRREALAIFSGPHAYISPDWYETDGLVPTWNYVAVHLTGKPAVVPEEQNAAHLDDLAAANEAHLAPKAPWTTARMKPDLHTRMVKGIVGVVMPVDGIQAKAKMSQNRGPKDKAGVIAGLRARGGDLNRAVVDWMESPT